MMKKIIITLLVIIGFYAGSQQTTHAESGLVAYWDFSEGSGSIIHNKVGLNDGVIYGATWIDGALNFNGINNYVKIPDTPALNPTTAITISMWIKPSKLGGIALNKEVQYRLIAEDVNSVKLSARVRTTNTNWGPMTGDSNIIVGNWQHVALTYDGSKWSIYFNGQLDSIMQDSGEIAASYGPINDGNLYLGHIGPNRGRSSDLFFGGLIDDVKIYNRALSVNEISIDYSDGHTPPIPTCTTWTYSSWDTCSSSGQQARTIISSSPNTCTGGNPILQQSCVFIPPTCTSWTYSDWSSCSSSGSQTRSINSSSPSSCTGGSPVINQSCVYTPPIPSCTVADWSCANWGTCSQNNSQTRTCAKNQNCQGGVSSPAISQSCTYVAPIPSCTSFNYSSWSGCSSDGKQTRNVISKYPYNCEGGESPKTTQSCTYTPPAPSCNADIWTCGTWGTCSLSGIQNRSCTKTFDCPNVQTAPPTTDQYCEAPSRPVQQVPQEGSDVISNQDVIIRSTVKLLCPVDAQKASQGSGTIIDSSGTILTNKHVIAGTLGCLVGFISDFNDEPYFGERQIADITKVSPNQDIAILKIRNPQNKALPNVDITKGNSNLRLGVKITTYGFPAKFGTKVTYTSGDFSGTDGNYIKTTAILDYGNSGGGAYLKDGTFIGIPSAVVKGELNALGYILSINTINSWLGNSSTAYGGTSSNNYSRVSVLEDIDLNKLGALKLFIPDTDTKGNLVAPPTNQSAQKTIEQSQNNQTQKESTIIESTDTNPKINPEQNTSVSSEKESAEEKENNFSIKISEQRRSTVANAVQEMVKVAERNGGIGQEIKTIAQAQAQNHGKIETSMQIIQGRSGFTKFFVGPNYSEINNAKKLLEQNREQIKRLDEIQSQITNRSDEEKLTEQVQLLKQTNKEIENSLNMSQKGFSLFGWVFRLFIR